MFSPWENSQGLIFYPPLFYCVNMRRVIHLSPRHRKWKIVLIFKHLQKIFQDHFSKRNSKSSQNLTALWSYMCVYVSTATMQCRKCAEHTNPQNTKKDGNTKNLCRCKQRQNHLKRGSTCRGAAFAWS